MFQCLAGGVTALEINLLVGFFNRVGKFSSATTQFAKINLNSSDCDFIFGFINVSCGFGSFCAMTLVQHLSVFSDKIVSIG